MTCDEAPFEELAQLEYRPNREELLRLCPYLENVECFESLVVEDSPVCTQKGGMYADAFLRHFHNLENENLIGKNSTAWSDCMHWPVLPNRLR
ncbi:hypothetical protein HNY73_016150 [Argiope bruennichi]|uniref:Uncharacterized protein n=1 Tax=Argiope bruennichi TaxID=94029 RepID=A0A8T0EIY9_ARGBR|nr:hypothetical protein HNY73_016150 [Argiope bruennichi]